ncbi:hypothetical protein G7Z17_g3309 [Cylindrodendrum hubeiense]|uniref:DUF8212 domain-containing protein n=1 Tax=Cylindrodendrum hubeiense TaxID=595255 RepID=A0A9P5LJH9_9HYPO|nr:hypothetical protein G7Z17_g3309 [Cylindrodendrum hubeiense]
MAAITGVTIPVRYGEGAERAFLRLQEEILHDTRDGSIFAWRSAGNEDIRGLLARSPSEFRHFATEPESSHQREWTFDGRVSFSSRGIQVESRASQHGSCILLDIGRLGTRDVQGHSPSDRFGVYLRECNGIYFRVNPAAVAGMSETGWPKRLDVARDIDSRSSDKIRAQFNINDQSIDAEIRQGICHNDSTGSLPQRPKKQDSSTKPTLPHELAEYELLKSPQPFKYSARSPSGTKRSRSGQPIMTIKSQRHRGRVPPLESENSEDDEMASSESELDDSSSTGSDSEDGLDSEDSHSLCEDNTVGGYDLDADHKFQSARGDMLGFLYDKIQPWMTSARYVAPPDNKQPPRKRARTTDCRPQSGYLEEEDQTDPELVVISRLDGYFDLACPFYVSNPTKYQHCLLNHDFPSIEDVTRHVKKHHTQPPYCPMCRQTFDRAVVRDCHVRARTCEIRTPEPIDGVSAYQKAELVKGDKPHLSDRRRWLHIWATIFPNTEPCHSPYLEDGIELAVTMARDHWAQDGMDYVAEYLADHHLLCQDQEGEKTAQAAIHSLMLEALLSKVVETHGSVEEG